MHHKDSILAIVYCISMFLLVLFYPICILGQVSDELNTGYPENGKFHGSGIESVQLKNGNLHVAIPVWSAKGRGLDTGFSFVYDNHGWKFSTHCYHNDYLGDYCQDNVVIDPLSNISLSVVGPFDYQFGTPSQTSVLCGGRPGGYTFKLGNYILREPDGTKHHFVPDPIGETPSPCAPFLNTLYADDGSGWILQIDLASFNIIAAISKNGTRILPDATGNALAIIDANGNQLTKTPLGPRGSGGTDTLGRTIPANGSYYDSSGTLQSVTVIPTSAGVPIHTHVCPFSQADQCTEATTSTNPLPYQIVLPNNLGTYTFTYAQDGGAEISSITLPTGGQISYTWGPWDEGGRRVASRTVTANGVSGTWRYQYAPAPYVDTWVIVTDPAGKDTKCTLSATGCGIEQYFDGTAGVSPLIKTIQTGDQMVYLGNAVISVQNSVTTTWNQQNLVSKVETDWDVAAVAGGNVTWRNPVERREYDWGNGAPGGLLKRTHYSYRHLESDGQAYLNANIADLPTLVQSYDGTGVLVAQSNNSYDESALASTGSCASGGAPGHSYCNYGAGFLTRGNVTRSSHWLNTNNTWLSTTYTYDDLGNVLSTTDPLNHTTTTNYDDNWTDLACAGSANSHAFATLVTNALGHRAKMSYYTCTGLVQGAKDENDLVAGRAGTIHTYDSMNRPLTTNFTDGGQTSFSYNDNVPMTITKTVKLTSTQNIVSSVQLDELGRSRQTHLIDPEGDVYFEVTFDALGRKQSVTNPHRATAATTDGVTQFTYDLFGRVTDITKQDGGVVHTDYAGNITTVTDETGRQRRSTFDGLGRLVEVDEPGDAFNGIQPSGTLTISGAEQTVYVNGHPAIPATGTVAISGMELSDDWGTVDVIANGFDCQISYGQGDLPETLAPRLITSINGCNPYVTASASGQYATVLLTARTAGNIGNTYSLSAFSASNGGFSPPSFTPIVSGSTLTGGAEAYAGTPTVDYGTVSVTINGNFTGTACYGPNPSSSCGGLNNSTAAAVAAALASTGPTGLNRPGSPVQVTVSGATLTIISNTSGTAGNFTTTCSASTGLPAYFSNPSFNCPGTASLGGQNSYPSSLDHPYVTLYHYNALSNLTCAVQKGMETSAFITCAGAPATWRPRSFTYDSLGRLLTANNPESGLISYFYDNAGNLLQKVMPSPNQTGSAQHTVSYCYDELNRVTGKAYSWQNCQGTQLPAGTAVVSYAYDQGANAKGKLTSLTDQAGSASYTYDVLGRIATETRVIAGISKNMSYGYNLDGSLKTLTYPSGAAVTYTPDSAGRILSAVDSGNAINYVISAAYGPDGALTGFVSGNSGTFAGITNSFSFNQRLQPVFMSASAPSQTVFSIGYDFHLGAGNNGNVYGIANNRDHTRDQTFTYDALNRLTSAQNSGTDCAQTGLQGKTKFWGNSYGYDAWGNLLSKSVTKCSAENLAVTALNNNQLVGYGYDAAGNMTSDPTDGTTAVYDQENRISTATKSGVSTTYLYDSDGNRVQKSSGGTGTLYWYMAPGIVAESDLTGNPTSEYVFFDGERVARRDGVNGAGGVFYYFSDHLKTASVITDAAGNIKSESDYYPWGGELQFTNNDSNHYKFTGKERDSETGLDYFGARYYSNGLGRWISADWSAAPTPVPYADFGDPQTLNQYSYVRNIPTTNIDADGHCDSRGLGKCSVLDHIAGTVGGLLNIVPETANIGNRIFNAVSGHFGGPQLEEAPLIQPDEHASQLGISLGTQAQVAIPLAEVAAEARAVGLAGEVGAATRGAATEGEAAGARAGATEPHPSVTTPYKRPSGATTAEQRASVQGKPCVDCGKVESKMVANHKTALVKEHYQTGKIDKANMRSVDAVNSHCTTCSAKSGGHLSHYSKQMKEKLKDRQN